MSSFINILIITLLVLNCALILFLIYKNPAQKLDLLKENQNRIERSIREETVYNSRMSREEISNSIKLLSDSLQSRMAEITTIQQSQLNTIMQTNEEKLEKMRQTVEQRLSYLQEDNSKKLEQMRSTVDEKLHSTLETRLGESFKLVNDRLEMVYRGLGEMQSLASGVGDLKRVLTNVKVRGTWGEIQLESVLEQILSREQYEKNVAIKKNSAERVEFAIKLPGRAENSHIWLPIDAKFPQEDYQRLLDAEETGDLKRVEESSKSLETTIKLFAKDIFEKYIDPPNTTDFAIMFLPTEGLYAEVLRRVGLCDNLQQKYRIMVAGPTTLIALLNSLQMGFRTLAIERRSSEVWALLGAVKTEFSKFGDILDKTHKKLQEASSTIESAAKKSRTIERKLKNVDKLEQSEIAAVIRDTSEDEGCNNLY